MMMDDEKILEHYTAKRKALMLELDVLNSVIESIEWKIMISSKEENASDIDIYFNTITQGSVKLGDRTDLSEFQKKQLRKYTKYNKSFTYNDKVEFALSKLKAATVYEMVDLIKMYDDSIEDNKLRNGLTMAASALNVSQAIGSKKEGKRNRYYLKSDEEETSNFKDDDDLF